MRRPDCTRRPLLGLLLVYLLASPLSIRPVVAQQDTRFFAQTGYRVADDQFWDYFRRRGGVRTFGYPVSNVFVLRGFRVQVFQREVLQQQSDGSVTLMNVLDDGLMPYTRINGSTFPSPDPEVIERQPKVGRPNYHVKALEFVRDHAPDVWEGVQVGFYRTFSSSVRLEDAFPDGKGDRSLLSGFNLEVWGLPTSRPTFDPNNAGFVYLRFQRGIMHFDATTGQTHGLLLADYVKSILTLRNLPPDLDADARSAPLYGQFDPRAPGWVSRPSDLPATDLTEAFRPEPVEALRRGPTVLVDPGHGGREIGASYRFPDGTMLVEKELNLLVATKVAQLLRDGGISTIMSRSGDAQVHGFQDLTGDGVVNLSDDLQARVDLANRNRADLIVSVHFNGVVDRTKRGTQVFYADGRPFSDRSRALADLTQNNLVRFLKEAGYETLDRRATPDSRLLGDGSHFYLLGPASAVVKRPSDMPGIIGEALFLTNEDDARALRQEKIEDAVARAYAEATKAYFQRFPPT